MSHRESLSRFYCQKPLGAPCQPWHPAHVRCCRPASETPLCRRGPEPDPGRGRAAGPQARGRHWPAAFHPAVAIPKCPYALPWRPSRRLPAAWASKTRSHSASRRSLPRNGWCRVSGVSPPRIRQSTSRSLRPSSLQTSGPTQSIWRPLAQVVGQTAGPAI